MTTVEGGETTSAAQRTRSPFRKEAVVARAALAVVAVHVADDLPPPQPGTAATDHLLSGLVPLAVLVLAAWAYHACGGSARLDRARARPVRDRRRNRGRLLRDDGRWPLGRRLHRAPVPGGWCRARRDRRRHAVAVATARRLRDGVGTCGGPRSRSGPSPSSSSSSSRSTPRTSSRTWAADSCPIPSSALPTRTSRSPPATGSSSRGGTSRRGTARRSSRSTAARARSSTRMLARHGYGVLLFDRRGEGESEETNTFGWGGEKDVRALAYLRTRRWIRTGSAASGSRSGRDDARGRRRVRRRESRRIRRSRDSVPARGARRTRGGPLLQASLVHALVTPGVALFSNTLPPPSLGSLGSDLGNPVFFIYADPGGGGEAELTKTFYDATRAQGDLARPRGRAHGQDRDAARRVRAARHQVLRRRASGRLTRTRPLIGRIPPSRAERAASLPGVKRRPWLVAGLLAGSLVLLSAGGAAAVDVTTLAGVRVEGGARRAAGASVASIGDMNGDGRPGSPSALRARTTTSASTRAPCTWSSAVRRPRPSISTSSGKWASASTESAPTSSPARRRRRRATSTATAGATSWWVLGGGEFLRGAGWRRVGRLREGRHDHHRPRQPGLGRLQDRGRLRARPGEDVGRRRGRQRRRAPGRRGRRAVRRGAKRWSALGRRLRRVRQGVDRHGHRHPLGSGGFRIDGARRPGKGPGTRSGWPAT